MVKKMDNMVYLLINKIKNRVNYCGTVKLTGTISLADNSTCICPLSVVV